MAFDTQIELITPENIAFRYRVAGPFRRLPAYLIDLLVRMGIMVGVSIGLSFLLGFTFGSMSTVAGVSLVVYFILDWFYGALFETYWNGQTPGKRLMQIRVVAADGRPIAGWQAVLRNFLRLVDGMPFFALADTGGLFLPTYIVGFVTAASNSRFQRLGDLWSGTIVVVEEPQRLYGMDRIEEAEVAELARTLPVDFRVSRSLARALSDYVARRKTFPWNRRMEIASHLGEPLRQRFELPPETNPDLLLCALYHRVFLADESEKPIEDLTIFEAPEIMTR